MCQRPGAEYVLYSETGAVTETDNIGSFKKHEAVILCTKTIVSSDNTASSYMTWKNESLFV